MARITSNVIRPRPCVKKLAGLENFRPTTEQLLYMQPCHIETISHRRFAELHDLRNLLSNHNLHSLPQTFARDYALPPAPTTYEQHSQATIIPDHNRSALHITATNRNISKVVPEPSERAETAQPALINQCFMQQARKGTTPPASEAFFTASCKMRIFIMSIGDDDT